MRHKTSLALKKICYIYMWKEREREKNHKTNVCARDISLPWNRSMDITEEMNISILKYTIYWSVCTAYSHLQRPFNKVEKKTHTQAYKFSIENRYVVFFFSCETKLFCNFVWCRNDIDAVLAAIIFIFAIYLLFGFWPTLIFLRHFTFHRIELC